MSKLYQTFVGSQIPCWTLNPLALPRDDRTTSFSVTNLCFSGQLSLSCIALQRIVSRPFDVIQTWSGTGAYVSHELSWVCYLGRHNSEGYLKMPLQLRATVLRDELPRKYSIFTITFISNFGLDAMAFAGSWFPVIRCACSFCPWWSPFVEPPWEGWGKRGAKTCQSWPARGVQ